MCASSMLTAATTAWLCWALMGLLAVLGPHGTPPPSCSRTAALNVSLPRQAQSSSTHKLYSLLHRYLSDR